MVGADVGDSSRGAERASAMWLPGSASGTQSAHAHMVLLSVALQRCTIDFMYFLAMLGLLCYYIPEMIAVVVLLAWPYNRLVTFYRFPARDLRRLET